MVSPASQLQADSSAQSNHAKINQTEEQSAACACVDEERKKDKMVSLNGRVLLNKALSFLSKNRMGGGRQIYNHNTFSAIVHYLFAMILNQFLVEWHLRPFDVVLYSQTICVGSQSTQRGNNKMKCQRRSEYVYMHHILRFGKGKKERKEREREVVGTTGRRQTYQ